MSANLDITSENLVMGNIENNNSHFCADECENTQTMYDNHYRKDQVFKKGVHCELYFYHN